MNANQINDPSCYSSFKLIPWGAVLAGAVVATGLSFLFNLFCVSIGLSIIPTSKEGVAALAVGGLVGLLISIIVTMFLAGMTTGYLARSFCPHQNLGILYGFIAWSLALILTVILALQMTQFITSYTDYIYGRAPTVNTAKNVTSPPSTVMPNENALNGSSDTTADMQKVANNVGYAAFIVFILFFTGAVSSCIGGYCGAGFNNKHDDSEHREKLRK